MKKLAIDLNSDVGEGYGPYRIGNDEDLFPYITSANIACGFHAGDPTTIHKTLELAAKYHVAVGAHPGYPDRLHFGRVALPYSNQEIVDFTLYQVGALQMLAESMGMKLQHIKLHGALYHVASADRKLSDLLLDALVRLQEPLIVVGPPNSVLQQESEERGIDFASEGFADRAYADDGKLVPRSANYQGLLTDPRIAADQAVQIARDHKVPTASGKKFDLRVHTLCIHGDTPNAARIAKSVREALDQARIAVEPLAKLLTE